MNVIAEGPIYLTLLGFCAAAVAIVVVLDFLLRPKTRARYPGGVGRYVLALMVQAAAFIVPIPFVTILLLGRVPRGVDFLAAIAAGVALVALLHVLPLTGPLLKDLRRTRLELALENVRT